VRPRVQIPGPRPKSDLKHVRPPRGIVLCCTSPPCQGE